MYQEKMAELHDEARMIANGTHPELVTLLAEIEEKKGKRIHSAEAWRKYQHDNFRQQFEGLEYQANIHFIVSCTRKANEQWVSWSFFSHKRMRYDAICWARSMASDGTWRMNVQS